MNHIVLHGCHSDSLLGYLKGIGVMRLVAEQLDRDCRGRWENGDLVLLTAASPDELTSFFIDRYRPTPVLNPWNKSTGFDGKAADRPSRLLDRIRAQQDSRWQPIQQVLRVLDALDIPTLRASTGKEDILRLLRSSYPDEALPWLDAVVAIGTKGRRFSELLGSGGNDGRLDFSVNFIERLIEVLEDRPRAERGFLIGDAVFGRNDSKAVSSAIGQFSLRYAAGANSTTGFNADSLINPWDFILLIEGSMLYAGGLSKRRSARGANPSFPFTFESTAAGFASASADEETRGEVWLPRWRGAASAAGIRALFRIGRMDAPGKVGDANRVTRIAPAHKAVEAAEAALTLGSGIGVEAFERVVIGKRNGLAFGALSVGEIPVTSDPAIRGLSSDARWWIERVRRSATMKSGHREPRLTGGVQAVDEALFQYARAPLADGRARALALQEVMIALAHLDSACHAAAARKSELRPLPFLPNTLYHALDEDSSLEHRLARSLAGLGGSAVSLRLRFDVAPVAMNAGGMAYADRVPEHWIPAQPLRSIAVLYQERLRLAIAGKREAVNSTSPAWPEEAVEIVEGALTPAKARRLSQLIEAYALIEPPRAPRPRAAAEAAVRIPAAFAVARLVLDRLRRGDLRVIDLLLARRASDALGDAVRRLRTVDGLPGLPRDVSAVGGIDPEHLAAALAIPLSHDHAAYQTLLQSGLRSTSIGAMNAYVSDLNTSTSKENR